MSRVLPHNLEAEASVLGGVMLRRDALDLPAVQALEADDFYSPKHLAVWCAVMALATRLEPIDPVTIDAELMRLDRSDAVGGLAFVSDLATRVPSAANVEHYASIVSRLSTRRKVIAAAADVVDRLYGADDDDEDLNGEAARTFALSTVGKVQCKGASSARTIGALVKDRVRQLDAIFAARERGEMAMTGIPTGVAELDERIGGYQPGIMTIVAGRPGHGKSSLMLAGADAASAAGYGVHMFPFEDSDESIADRAMAGASGVGAEAIRTSSMNRGDFANLADAMNKLAKREQWILEHRPSPYVDDIIRAVRRDAEKNRTKLAIVDYIQLLRGPRSHRYRGASDREQEISDISTAFMLASRDDGIAYVVGSQLNRDCERRDDKRPVPSDMRGSGALEERAKCVILVYRGCVNGPAVAGTDEIYRNGRSYLPLDDEWASLMELLVEKNSNGRTGRVLANFDGPTLRVS